MPEPIIIKLRKECENTASFPVNAPVPLEEIMYGRFSVSDIRACDDRGYEFIGLELPIGTYSSLILFKDLLDNGKKKVFSGWRKWNAKPERDTIVMPAWLRHALMVVCYQKKDDHSLKAVVQKIRETIWIPDAHTNCPVNATSIAYQNNSFAVVTHGAGLSPQHSLYHQISDKPVAGESQYLTRKSKSIIPALEALLYDNDPARVKEVWVWAMNPRLKSCYLYRLNANATGKRCVAFGVYDDDDANVDADVAIIDDTRPARGVAVEEKNFQRK